MRRPEGRFPVRKVYIRFLRLPGDFGQSSWQTKLSIPYRGDAREISIGMASADLPGLIGGNIEDVRFLSTLFCVLLGGGDDRPVPPPREEVRLKDKQVVCLRWAAAGKSYDDIAEILGITERAVRYYLNGARKRYGVPTIMQTIVKAAQQYGFDPLDAR